MIYGGAGAIFKAGAERQKRKIKGERTMKNNTALHTKEKEREPRNEGPVVLKRENVLIIAKLTDPETERIIEQLFSKKSLSQ